MRWFIHCFQAQISCITGYTRMGRAGALLTGSLFGCGYRGRSHGRSYLWAEVYGLRSDLVANFVNVSNYGLSFVQIVGCFAT